jgi:hypothetical protein
MILNISVELTSQDECNRLEHSVPEFQPIPSVEIGYEFDPAYIPIFHL